MNLEKEKDAGAEIHTGLKLLAKSSVIVFVGVFLSKLFAYIYRIVIARQFGPEVYGLYSLALIILGLFVAVSSFGLTEGLVRFIPLYRGKKQINRIKYLIKTLIIILILSSAVFSIFLFSFSNFISLNIFHNENLIIFLKIFSFLIPLTILSTIFLNILRSFEKIELYSFTWNILPNFVRISTVTIFIFLGFKTNAIIFSYFLSILIMLLVSYFLCKFKLPEIFGYVEIKKEDKREIAKNVFSYSWPIMFSSLIANIFYWIDSILLGYFLGAQNVGIYNAATPLVGLMAFIPSIFTQLFFPLITREFSKKNYNVIAGLSKQVGKWICILNLPLFLIMIVFPGTLLNLFFGEQYLSAASVLRILSIGGFISSLTFLSTDLISMIGKSKLILANISLASLLNILLNILLIPKYGLNGAAIATSTVTILLSIVLLIEVKHYVQLIPLRRKIIRILLISAIPILLIIFFNQFMKSDYITLVFLGFFLFLSYILLLIITKSFDEQDISILRAIKRKLRNKG